MQQTLIICQFTKQFTYRDFKYFCNEAFEAKTSQIDCNKIYMGDKIVQKLRLFTDEILTFFDKCVPLKTTTVKKP